MNCTTSSFHRAMPPTVMLILTEPMGFRCIQQSAFRLFCLARH